MALAYRLSNAYRGVKYATAVAALSMLPSVAHAQQTNQNNNKQQTAQSQAEEETSKKPVFKVNLSGDNLDGKSKLFFNGEGFVPYLRIGNNLFAAQGTGRYSRSSGSNTFEVDAGQVLNHLFDNGSLAQIAAFYQQRRDSAGSLDFKLGSFASSYQSGRGKFSFYFGRPLSKEKLSNFSSSSSLSESEEGRVTSTTRTTIDHSIYSFAREVATARAEFQVSPNLRVASGGAWHGGSQGYTLEGSNFIEIRENVPSELRAIIGAIYSSGLFFGKNTEARVEVRAGQGKPQYSVVISTDFRNYTRKNIGNLRANLATPVDNLERIVTANSRVTRTTKENSAIVSLGDCPDVTQEGGQYACSFKIDAGNIVEILHGHPALSLSTSNTSTSSALTLLASAAISVIYSGTFGYDDAGEIPIEMLIKGPNGLPGKLKYILRIANTNRKPTVILPSETPSVNEGQRLELLFKAEDPDREDQGKLVLKALYNGGDLPSWITAEYLTDAVKLVLAPGYFNSGMHNISVRATDPEGLYDEKGLEQRVNDVNRAPGACRIISPEVNSERRVGEALDVYVNQEKDPDGDAVTCVVKLTPIQSGRGRLISSDLVRGESRARKEFFSNDHIGRYKLSTTNSDGKAVTTYENNVIITVDPRPRTIPTLEARCSASPSSANTGQTITWTGTPSGGDEDKEYVHIWSGTDGFSSSSQSDTKIYSTSGVKQATYTATRGDQTKTASCSVTINAPTTTTPTLEATCSGSPNPANTNQTVTWTGTPSGGTGTYTHNWSNAVTATTQTATATYSTSGTKTATYTATSGDQTKSANCSITVNTPTQPDLIVQNITKSIADIVAGNSVTFSGDVKNQGDDSAAASTTRVRLDLSNNGTYDLTLSNIATDAVAAGAVKTVTSSSWTATAGTHKVEFCADTASVITESNESNNCATSTFSVVAAPPPPPP